MADTIRKRGFPVHELPSPLNANGHASVSGYSDWLGVSPEQDAAETREALQTFRPNWLVVDHYALDAEWEKLLRNDVDRIAVVDDLANRAHECDVLVDQNYFPEGATRYQGLTPAYARLLLGPQFALLRDEYADMRRLIGPRRGVVARVLVFYGGSDPSNETGRALRVLNRPEFRHLAVDAVIGANNAHRREVESLAAQRPFIELIEPRPHLAELIAEADLALGAGGTTTWERCALGLPSIVTAVAENQIRPCEALAETGAIHYLGHRAEVTEADLCLALASFLEDETRLSNVSERAWWITDGLGRLRVAEALNPTDQHALRLRPTSADDKSLYFKWANDPDTRRYANHSKMIPWSTHDSWFDARLQDANSHMWVMITPDGLPVGQVRADVQDDKAVLDYSVDPYFRGRGWGKQLLELGAAAWYATGSNLPLMGEVRIENEASCRAFLRAGFEEVGISTAEKRCFRLPFSRAAQTASSLEASQSPPAVNPNGDGE